MKHTRLPGLDTLRALAITLVYAYHYRIFVSAQPDLGWFATVGWAGVDLFFVLSGYLMAEQLLRGLAAGERLQLGAFYARRAFRILPLFWLVLAAYALFPNELGGRTPPPWWRFLSFTQNWGLEPGTAFSHAWSLCVEEQFYLVLPLALWCITRSPAGGSGLGRGALILRIWLPLLALIAAAMLWRHQLWLQMGLEAGGQTERYYPELYYNTLARADAFLPGVAVALLQHLHPATWQRVQRHGQLTLALGVAALAALFAISNSSYYVEGYGYGWFMTVLGYSLQAMAFGLLVLAALSPQSWLARFRVPGAASVALWSYALYLIHKPVGFVLRQQLVGLDPWLLMLVVTAACLALSALLFKLVETPFMRLRARWVPGNFASTGRAAGGASHLVL